MSGLAKVGSQTALSFAFAFLRRTWRSGEDTDLCCGLLQDSTEALRYDYVIMILRDVATLYHYFISHVCKHCVPTALYWPICINLWF